MLGCSQSVEQLGFKLLSEAEVAEDVSASKTGAAASYSPVERPKIN